MKKTMVIQHRTKEQTIPIVMIMMIMMMPAIATQMKTDLKEIQTKIANVVG